MKLKKNDRVGISTEKGDCQAPVGYDQYSYSYRDKEGDTFASLYLFAYLLH